MFLILCNSAKLHSMRNILLRNTLRLKSRSPAAAACGRSGELFDRREQLVHRGRRDAGNGPGAEASPICMLLPALIGGQPMPSLPAVSLDTAVPVRASHQAARRP